MKIENWPRIFSWPMYSSSARGRSVRSRTSSCGLTGAAAIRRSVSIMVGDASVFRQQFQRLPDAIRHRNAFGQLPDRMRGLLVAVAERSERMEDVRRHRRGAIDADRRRQIGAELVLQFEQQPLRGLLADAGNLGQPAGFLQR